MLVTKRATSKPAKPKRSASKKPSARTLKKPAVKKSSRPAATTSARSTDALAKKITMVSADTKSLTKDLKVVVKIFGENQKILVSMKKMIDNLVGALDTIQKQSKKISMLETDTQKIFDGMSEIKVHARMISKLDSQAAKLHETIRGIDERARVSGGVETISEKINENYNSIKNNSEMIIKIGRHIDTIRNDVSGLSSRTSAIDGIRDEIEKLKSLFDEVLSKHGDDSELSAELAALAQKMSALSGVPVEISGIQKRLGEMSGVTGTLTPIVDELRSQIGRVASKVDSTGSIDAVKSEFASLRDEVLGRAGKVEAGIASVSEALGRSERSVSEFHKKVNALFENMRGVRVAGERAAGESTGEVMALLRLSEFQSNVRMTAESKYGEVSDLEEIASQTVDVLNVFDKLAVETGTNVHLPHGVRQWAVSKIFECADRWEIRFSDVLRVLRDKLGTSLLKESVRMSQVRDIYGTRAVDELESALGSTAHD